MRRSILSAVVCLGLATACRADGDNLIHNGSFEGSQARAGGLDGWTTAGNPALRQTLTLDAGRDGGHSARLDCTVFDGDGPDFHAMLCQVGKVSVTQGKWYRLRLWAKVKGLKAGAVEIGLVNTRGWVPSGLNEAFNPGPRWAPVDFLFQAQANVPADTSRFQLWFKSTGTLWLDDLSLVETTRKPQWYPQIGSEGVANAVPNSSFECGTSGWGSLTFDLGGWAGNLFRLEGELDPSQARHGRQSLKITLDTALAPVCWFDYYEPIRAPVKRALAANRGWILVSPDATLTLSAYLRGDEEGTVAQLAVNEAPERLRRKQVRVGREWTRHEFTFTPTEPFLFVAVGLDLQATNRARGTLWVDAIQLERGTKATEYHPRAAVESYVDMDVPGHVVDAQAGASLTLRAYNDSDGAHSLAGRLDVIDAFGQTAALLKPALNVPAHSGSSQRFEDVAKGRLGAFRARWRPEPGSGFVEPDPETPDGVATLSTTRFAVIDPLPANLHDAPFGFNHAYPWDFLVRSAHRAGAVWWRDWSAKWNTVEPQRGTFDWSVPDAQIGRVAAQGGNVEILLPFPSASWSTSARPEVVAKAAGRDGYLRARLPMAFAPRDLDDFGHYAAQTALHYRLTTKPTTALYVQILNEPVYTDYALPQAFGYSIDDYVKLLQVAHDAMKKVDPHVQVVGGLSAGLTSGYTREFIRKGGLKACDVLDLHIYDPARPAENYEEEFKALEELVNSHGGKLPVWITEWGCYADDDPPTLPLSVGDSSMNRCRWPSERAATEHIVKFAAVGFAHGLRKIFFHAGTAGRINGSDAGGVLFEYGGTPRTMYAGLAAFTKRLGGPVSPIAVMNRDDLHAYVFRTRNVAAVEAVVWASAERAKRLSVDPAVSVFDMMGNRVADRTIELSETPVYLAGDQPEPVLRTLDAGR